MSFSSKFHLAKIIEVAPITTERVLEFDGVRPYVATADVQDGEIVNTTQVNFESKPSRADISVKSGDVIFARMQNTNKVLLINDENKNHIFSTGFAVCRATQYISSTYLRYWLKSEIFNEQKDSYCTGATQKAISNSGIEKLTIPLPPFSVQERIVQLLDEAEVMKNLRRRAEVRMEQFIPALFQEMFGHPITNTKDWKIFKLENIAKIERGRFSPRPRNDPKFYDGIYPFVQTGDIASSNGYLTTWTQTLNELGIKVSKCFDVGTILIAIVGATIGETTILGIKTYCPDSAIGITVNREIAVPEYVEFVLRFWKPIFRAQAPETARANINLGTLRPVKIPLPPIALQHKFAEIVMETRNIQSKQALSTVKIEALFKSTLAKVFEGNL